MNMENQPVSPGVYQLDHIRTDLSSDKKKKLRLVIPN
jgi:hypothetical protein